MRIVRFAVWPSGSGHWPHMPEFEALIAARKACRICVERSPGKIRSCAEFDFDPDVVSHWEQWLGHRSPKLLVVGQDFGNVGYFVRCRGRDEPNNKTNENLYQLLTAAGIAVQHPSQRDRGAPVFLTNSILCIKEGAMNAPILASWVDACSEQHLLPLIAFLKPAGRRRDGQRRMACRSRRLCAAWRAAADFARSRLRLARRRQYPGICRRPLRATRGHQPAVAAAARGLAADRRGRFRLLRRRCAATLG